MSIKVERQIVQAKNELKLIKVESKSSIANSNNILYLNSLNGSRYDPKILESSDKFDEVLKDFKKKGEKPSDNISIQEDPHQFGKQPSEFAPRKLIPY